MIEETIEDLKWAIDARCRIQKQLLILYEIWDQHKCHLEGSQGEDNRSSFTKLVGAAFSLWRAAFLCANTRSGLEIMNKAVEFLKELIRTNSISFRQDLSTRHWTVGYYVNNAKVRLGKTLNFVEERPLQSEWDELFEELVKQVDKLKNALGSSEN